MCTISSLSVKLCTPDKGERGIVSVVWLVIAPSKASLVILISGAITRNSRQNTSGQVQQTARTRMECHLILKLDKLYRYEMRKSMFTRYVKPDVHKHQQNALRFGNKDFLSDLSVYVACNSCSDFADIGFYHV
ncbi:hypothetical protein CLF_102363 [Clonorchis sinensis]|uniref:Uncharacterized protein n=1 Tax=Clonorchis sinensis TaxID=79923 RepID=G7Y7R5_CLOSI|nr:hypothetical protein CLF_102363 [Clonorchis sinensis]